MDPVHAESDPLKVTHFRGFGILAFRATILAGLTPEQQELLLARLGPQCQELMRRPPDAEEWVPIEHLQEIRTVFSQLFGLRLDKVRGLTMASLLFSGSVFEPLKNTRNISLFLTKFPQIWATYHKGGRAETTLLGQHSARISIQAKFPYPQYLNEVIPPAFQEVLNLLGLSGGRVKHTAPSPGDLTEAHLYDLAWEP